jgi:predicted NBD/HSP70 family sugar kinase
MHIASVGIDIGKITFHLAALNEHGSIVVRKEFSRSALPTYTANLSSSLWKHVVVHTSLPGSSVIKGMMRD